MGSVSLRFWGLSQPFAASATAEGLQLGTPTWGSMRQVLLKSQVQLHSHSQDPDPQAARTVIPGTCLFRSRGPLSLSGVTWLGWLLQKLKAETVLGPS